MKLSSQINLGLCCLAVVVLGFTTFLEFNRTTSTAIQLIENETERNKALIDFVYAQASNDNEKTKQPISAQLRYLASIDTISVIKIIDADVNTAFEFKKEGEDTAAVSWFGSLTGLDDASSQIALSNNKGTLVLKPSVQHALTLFIHQIVTNFLVVFIFVVFGVLIVRFISKRAHADIDEATRKLNDIVNHNFTSSPVESYTSDYSYLLSAINNVSLSLETKFQELTRQAEQFKFIASKDALTKLANRNAFDRHMAAFFNGGSGYAEKELLIVRLAKLNTINTKLGTQAGDHYVVAVSEILARFIKASFKNAHVFRISGGDFAVSTETVEKGEMEDKLSTLSKQLNAANPMRDGSKTAWIGVTKFTNSMEIQEVMESADSALIAATKLERGWQFSSEISQVHSNARWRERLNYIISQQYADIIIQPVMDTELNKPDYFESFGRFKDRHTNEIIPMSQLIPASERLDLVPQVDKLITNMVLKKLGVTSQKVGINITNASIANDEFRRWLVNQLKERDEICPRLVFEIEDSALINFHQEAVALCKDLIKLGCRITVEHFGDNFASLSGLRAIQPHFVKLSGRLTQSIHTNKDNQLFVSSLTSIARTLNIKVIAEMVENEAESVALNTLDITHQQGYYFAKPTMWSVY